MRPPYRHASEIAGYTYRADLLCPSCTIEAMIGAGDAGPAARDMPTEDVLEQCAGALGIDRDDEHTFDSDEFPKVALLDHLAANEACAACHEAL
jgi:hypothetical protein